MRLWVDLTEEQQIELAAAVKPYVVRELAAEYAERDALIARLAEALRLTQEYVGDATLPALPGWEWFDALEEYKAYMANVPPSAAEGKV